MHGICPHCGQTVGMTHNGRPSGFDERTDPWEFDVHEFMDRRDDQLVPKQCPGSGRNSYTAANSS